MKLLIFSDLSTWARDEIGGSDSFMRRVLLGFKQNDINYKHFYISNYSEKTTKDKIHLISAIKLILKNKKSTILFYRIKPFHRIIIGFLARLFCIKINSIVPFSLKTKFYFVNAFLYMFFTTNKLIVLSKNLKKQFLKFNIESTIILPPIPSLFKTTKIEKYNSHTPTVTFVGRIDKRKGVDLTIALFLKLSALKVAKCRFYGIYISDDNNSKELDFLNNQKLFFFKLINRKKYSKKIDTDLLSWLDNTDYFIQPYNSIHSTVDTPLLLLESLSRGCKVYSTKIQQAIDILGEENTFTKENFVNDVFHRITNNEKYLYPKNLLILDEKKTAEKFINEIK